MSLGRGVFLLCKTATRCAKEQTADLPSLPGDISPRSRFI